MKYPSILPLSHYNFKAERNSSFAHFHHRCYCIHTESFYILNQMDYKTPELPARYDHAAVCIENHIIVFGGVGEKEELLPLHDIWMYNMYTEQWGKHVIPERNLAPPGTSSACAVAIAGDIYMFGGYIDDIKEQNCTNAVWKLTRTSKRCFTWRKCTKRNKKKMPSPRHSHSGWEYTGQLWTFGGFGVSPAGYLEDHGDFVQSDNNQLLCYDPSSEEWRNPKPFGTVPQPRARHATTLVGDKVWMYGGFSFDLNIYDELYQLDMVSLTWTEIQTGQFKPPSGLLFTLNAITESQLVLYGGESLDDLESLSDIWIFDLASLSWQKYEATRGTSRSSHTGTACMNNNVTIIGGYEWFEFCESDSAFRRDVYNDIFAVRLEPKRLQKLAIQKIYQHRKYRKLYLELLPDSLKKLFLFPVTMETIIEVDPDTMEMLKMLKMTNIPGLQVKQASNPGRGYRTPCT